MPSHTAKHSEHSSKSNARTQRRHSRLTQGVREPTKTHIVQQFMNMLNTVKIYHWNTHSYPEHKATDELYSRLNEHIDMFVEVMLGKDGSRIRRINSLPTLVGTENKSALEKKVASYKHFLIELNHALMPERDSDLLNIRDEILGDMNQFTYLLTLK